MRGWLGAHRLRFEWGGGGGTRVSKQRSSRHSCGSYPHALLGVR